MRKRVQQDENGAKPSLVTPPVIAVTLNIAVTLKQVQGDVSGVRTTSRCRSKR